MSDLESFRNIISSDYYSEYVGPVGKDNVKEFPYPQELHASMSTEMKLLQIQKSQLSSRLEELQQSTNVHQTYSGKIGIRIAQKQLEMMDQEPDAESDPLQFDDLEVIQQRGQTESLDRMYKQSMLDVKLQQAAYDSVLMLNDELMADTEPLKAMFNGLIRCDFFVNEQFGTGYFCMAGGRLELYLWESRKLLFEDDLEYQFRFEVQDEVKELVKGRYDPGDNYVIATKEEVRIILALDRFAYDKLREYKGGK